MRIIIGSSQLDAEKNDERTCQRTGAGWPPAPDLVHSEGNSAQNDSPSVFTRIFSQIFPQKPRKPSQGESLPKEPPREEPPYSEAESRQASAKLWSIYIAEAERYDKALVESWKADMEGMLIFSGLFSASLTAFLVESYKTLQPDSGAITTRLLTQISQQLAAPGSLVSLNSSEFHPTHSSLVCNTLWFISLTLSITCALLATLVEQWAREFLHRTESHPSPIRRARVFSFLYFGLRRFAMHSVVDLIPLLLHVSLVLFLGGLVAFLLPINPIMVALIASILAGFLSIYTFLTVLPIIRLDCPFRTPFSGPMWNLSHVLVAYIFPHRVISSPSPTMNDAMVEMALRPSESRDQRALMWTVDSLTDDTKLLPFLDAIPEAIYGAGGFHHRNDYLFMPLLDTSAKPYGPLAEPANPQSLSERIVDFILSCRNMAADDPHRRRRLVAAMKAIWALGMISDIAPYRETTGGGLWFGKRTTGAVTPRPTQPNWPRSDAHVAMAAIAYSRLNNLRSYINIVSCLADPQDLLDGIRTVIPMAKILYFDCAILRHHIEQCAVWVKNPRQTEPDSLANVKCVLKTLVQDMSWVEEISVSLAARLLLQIAPELRDEDALLPVVTETCHRMVPSMGATHLVPLEKRMSRSVFSRETSSFDPSRNPVPSGQISVLDHIMKALIRLLPQLLPGDVGPILALYLSKRNDYDALHFTIPSGFALGQASQCLVMMLGSNPDPDHILGALSAIIVLPQYPLTRWEDHDERLWQYLADADILGGQSFTTLCSVMKMRKYENIGNRASSNFPDPPAPATLLELSNHDLLPRTARHAFVASTPENIMSDVESRVMQGKIVVLTNFLSRCLDPIDMRYGTTALVSLLSGPPTDVDTEVMASFGQAWHDVIHNLSECPTDDDLHVFQEILQWAEGYAEFLCHLPTASLFKDAILLYLRFLEAHNIRDSATVKHPERVLAIFASHVSGTQ